MTNEQLTYYYCIRDYHEKGEILAQGHSNQEYSKDIARLLKEKVPVLSNFEITSFPYFEGEDEHISVYRVKLVLKKERDEYTRILSHANSIIINKEEKSALIEMFKNS